MPALRGEQVCCTRRRVASAGTAAARLPARVTASRQGMREAGPVHARGEGHHQAWAGGMALILSPHAPGASGQTGERPFHLAQRVR